MKKVKKDKKQGKSKKVKGKTAGNPFPLYAIRTPCNGHFSGKSPPFRRPGRIIGNEFVYRISYVVCRDLNEK